MRTILQTPVRAGNGTYAVTCQNGHVETLTAEQARRHTAVMCHAYGPDWSCGKVIKYFLPQDCDPDLTWELNTWLVHCPCGWRSTLIPGPLDDDSEARTVAAAHLAGDAFDA